MYHGCTEALDEGRNHRTGDSGHIAPLPERPFEIEYDMIARHADTERFTMNTRLLSLDYVRTDAQDRTLEEISGSSRDPEFQIERASLKASQENRVPDAISSWSPQVILFFISGAQVPQATVDLPAVRQCFFDVPILIVVETGDLQEASEILDVGADDFILLPARPSEILLRVRKLLDRSMLEDPVSQSLKQKFGLKQMIGESASLLSVIKKLPFLAKSDANILITGETGTGKELCARAIHYLSGRARGPFIPVNCGAIPLDLVENELFGHEKGAFTGAADTKTGLIHEAETGTLFLDEIDGLPLSAQVKLLRFLQEKEYRPLGSRKVSKADVRILAALNVDPQEAMDAGRLRQDLYYRLNVIPLSIPSLRDRREDIPLLARHFLLKYAVQFNKPMADFSEEAIRLLQGYDWPGNVRELEHHVERAVVLSEGRRIETEDIVLPAAETEPPESMQDAKMKMVAAFERSYIERLLLAHHGNISQAARAAQKNRRAFWELIRKYNIDVQSFKTE